jgi:hypothetical protein
MSFRPVDGPVSCEHSIRRLASRLALAFRDVLPVTPASIGLPYRPAAFLISCDIWQFAIQSRASCHAERFYV